MIIKVIQHNNMPRSVNYLYEKAKESKETPAHPLYNASKTKDHFMDEIDFVLRKKEDETGKKLTLNNQIKHLVLAFHPSEKDIFNEIKESVLNDLFDKIGIDPENHNVNAFVHNDQQHPHIHLIFSRIGYDKSIFNDKNIGRRVGEYAKTISKKYDLKHSKSSNSISFTSKELYKPTSRSLLKKCISFAMNESNSIEEFQNILKNHGVSTKISDGKIIYLTPKSDVIAKDHIPKLIDFAKSNSKNYAEYKRILNNNGLYIKQDRETGKDIFSIQKVQTWTEDVMPSSCRLHRLKESIRNNSHDSNYINTREQLKLALNQCKSLGDLQKMFPDSKITYKINNNQIHNLRIELNDYIIRLDEVLDKEIELDPKHQGEQYIKIPLIFTPNNFSDFEENKQKMLAKKYGKKSYQIGFKIQV